MSSCALALAHLPVGVLERAEIEPLLVAEIVVDHPLAGAGAGGDLVDPRAGQAVERELLRGDLEDVLPRPLGILRARRRRAAFAARPPGFIARILSRSSPRGRRLTKLTSSYIVCRRARSGHLSWPAGRKQERFRAEAGTACAREESRARILVQPGSPDRLVDAVSATAVDCRATVRSPSASSGAASRLRVRRSCTSARAPGSGSAIAYVLIDFDELELAGRRRSATSSTRPQTLGFAGLNVTHPFKQTVIALLDGLVAGGRGDRRGEHGRVRRRARIGHNTDSWGFAESFSREHGRLRRCDRASSSAPAAPARRSRMRCSSSAPQKLTVCRHRRSPCADDLAATTARAIRRARDVASIDRQPRSREPAGVVNATPVGMAKYPGMPFRADLLSPRHWVAEIIYFPAETELCDARARLAAARWRAPAWPSTRRCARSSCSRAIAPDRAAMIRTFRGRRMRPEPNASRTGR